ncbi:transposable element Tcb2 transposase [Trichonephila clavipes]|nr:transposable element Tcb2 transposase [Trichonephila clavipes]
MCLVVLFSDFGINTNPKILCPEDLFRPTTSYNTCRRPFSSSFGTKEKNHYCAAARCRPLSSIRKKNLRYYGAKIVFTMQVCMQEDQLCAFPQRTTAKGTAYAGQENMFLGRSNNGLLCCSQTSPDFTMESDSGRLPIRREQRTRYHQSNTVERHSYRGGGILVLGRDLARWPH